MEKYNTNMKKNLLLAALINGLVLAALLLLFRPYFEVNDDAVLRDLINGSRIVSDPHLIYQNILLGWLYKGLYAAAGSLPWYELVQYALIFCSLTAVVYVSLQRAGMLRGLLLSLPGVVIAGYECYISMQYTKTAGIACAAGCLLLVYAVSCRETARGAAVNGILLICFGFAYRSVQAAACCALMAGLGLWLVLSGRPLIARCFRWCAALLVSLAVVFAVDTVSYRVSDTWRNFRSYDRARQELLDYGRPDYGTFREEYERYGLDRTANTLLSSWQFADQDVFTREAFEGIAALKEKPDYINKVNLKQYLIAFPQTFFHTQAFYLFFLYFILFLLLRAFWRKGWVVFLYEFLMMGAMYYYLYLRGRYLVNRVDIGLWFSIAMVLLYLVLDQDPGRQPSRLFALSAGAACVGACVLMIWQCPDKKELSPRWSETVRTRMKEASQKQEQFEKLVDTCTRLGMSDKGEPLIIAAGGIAGDSIYQPFQAPAKGLMKNVIWLGGWETFSAAFYETLHAHGVENAFRDVIDREDVVLTAVTDMDRVLQYIRAHYDEQAREERLDGQGPFVISRVISEGS